jgi:hypothetical protein
MTPLLPFLAAGALASLGAGYVVLRAELAALAPGQRLPLARWTLLGLQSILSAFVLCLLPILSLFDGQRSDPELGPEISALARGSAAGLLAFLPGAAATLFLAVQPLYGGRRDDRRIVGPLLAAGLYGAAMLAVALSRERFFG